jgi:hypothetical protein
MSLTLSMTSVDFACKEGNTGGGGESKSVRRKHNSLKRLFSTSQVRQYYATLCGGASPLNCMQWPV